MDLVLTNFHFVRPLWLFGCIPAVVLFIVLWFIRVRSSGWSKAIESSLLSHLLDSTQEKRQGWPLFMLLLAWLLTCLSLAGPVWEKLPQPVQKKENALVIIQDLSLSFYAQDLSPNRLVRAQHKLSDLLKERKEGTTALVVYSGDAHIVSPLTDDSRTIAAMVPSLSPGIMPSYGSNVVDAVKLALGLLKDAGVSQGKMLLLTDEVTGEDAREVTKLLRGKNIVFLVLGIGTSGGGPIPKNDGGFLKDDEGNIIVPRLNREILRDLAEKNGGRYRDVQLNDQDIEYLLAAEALLPNEDEYRQMDREFDQWKEMGPWLLLLILPIALLAFRRGWLLVFVIMILLESSESHAMSWQDLWQRKDQQAAKALQSNDPGKAAELFQTPSWKGVAEYNAGNFAEAADSFAQNQNADNFYNSGNALTKENKLDEALKAYEQALQLNPEMEDAQFNKELVEQLIQQQQQQQQGEGEDNESGDQEKQEDQQGEGEDQQSGQDGQSEKQGEQGKQGQQQTGEENEQDSSVKDKGDMNKDDGQEQDESAQEQQGEMSEEGEQSKDEKEMSGRESQEDSSEKQETEATMQSVEDEMTDEEKQSLEQWLRQVPDNPGGLLRRKFEYESQLNRERQTPRQNKKIW